jgi:two-component system C4-dicarboxylate transport sensor histidine kinase DctB
MTSNTGWRIGAILVFLAAVAAFSGGVWRYGYGVAIGQLARGGQADLALATDRLTGELQRFQSVGVLMADHPGVARLLRAGRAAGGGHALLQGVADKTGSLDIIVAGPDGQALAAALPGPLENYRDAPFFRRAMDGALGQFHEQSTRYGRRVFVYASPVFSPQGPVAGAVITVVDIEAVEAEWRGGRPAVFFTDQAGVIFLSNRSELVLRTRQTGPARAGEGRFFGALRSRDFVGHDLWYMDGERYLPSVALHLTQSVPLTGLQGEALVNLAPARALAALQATVAATLCLTFGAFLLVATERRRALADLNQKLEKRVIARTAALQAMNADLQREVAERTAAQERLKKAQADLVQAGKLSALGQMSAGISHELNQPLMAIRSFAENAQTYLDRGNTATAGQNLARISELARRMGRIIANLRAFARQENEALTDVDLCAVVQAALEMAAPRLRQDDVALAWVPPAAPVMVRGGEVRMQQVVLNLITNATDAMSGAANRALTVAISTQQARVVLSIRDTGPGIAEPARIFDPFYTTKQISSEEGMGLGLSISYGLVQSFGGQIKGRNHPDGGAVFTVELDAAARRLAA